MWTALGWVGTAKEEPSGPCVLWLRVRESDVRLERHACVTARPFVIPVPAYRNWAFCRVTARDLALCGSCLNRGSYRSGCLSFLPTVWYMSNSAYMYHGCIWIEQSKIYFDVPSYEKKNKDGIKLSEGGKTLNRENRKT